MNKTKLLSDYTLFHENSYMFSPTLEGMSEMVLLKYRPHSTYDIYMGDLKGHLKWVGCGSSESLKQREKVT